jgi:hypothetical protein
MRCLQTIEYPPYGSIEPWHNVILDSLVTKLSQGMTFYG